MNKIVLINKYLKVVKAGLQYSSITNCTLIAATGPAITALIATIFIHERLNFIQWIGIFISFIGVIFLITKGSIDVLLNFNFNT